MNKTNQNVTLSLVEAMDVLQILHTVRNVTEKQDQEESVDAVMSIQDLQFQILNGDRQGDMFSFGMSTEDLFQTWMYVDLYRQFLKQKQITYELPAIRLIMTKLSASRPQS